MNRTFTCHLLLDMLRVLTGASVALVLLMSFGASIDPLSDGLLGPQTLLRFVLYTAPTMLQFALPFAAAMASTLVYVRLAQDNEALACQASGMSPMRILMPAVAMGLCLTAGQFVLSGWLTPHYHHRAKQVLKGDVFQLVAGQLGSGQAFAFRGTDAVLYADKAELVPQAQVQQMMGGVLEVGERVEQMLRLEGVVVTQASGEGAGQRRGELTAHLAHAALVSGSGGRVDVLLSLAEPRAWDASEGRLLTAERIENFRLPLPDLLRDSPEFLAFPALFRILEEPERYDRVRDAGRALSDQMRLSAVAGWLPESLRRVEPLLLDGRQGRR